MNLEFAFAPNPRDWSFGYCTAFADLGMASLVIGPLHVQFGCDVDRAEELAPALRSPRTALRAWMAERWAPSGRGAQEMS
ncbi:MAG: hypothetical protein JNM89_16005 [Hyphomicrobiaceae bacterium]|nr:hypothetical protein [Hyphomicrobiaceae bacterium]